METHKFDYTDLDFENSVITYSEELVEIRTNNINSMEDVDKWMKRYCSDLLFTWNKYDFENKFQNVFLNLTAFQRVRYVAN